MRQGQQNRRGRGRNRKGQNPLTRSFESNGPDVKIRGTPSHIAEKYISLARDASASGDPVLAENYLQHAEHYNRIIMAYREQHMQQGGDTMNGGFGRHRQPMMNDSFEPGDEFGDDEGDDMPGDPSPQPPNFQESPRPFEGQRFERHPRGREQFRQQRERPDRPERQPDVEPRAFPEPRNHAAEPAGEPGMGQPSQPRHEGGGRTDNQPRRRERFAQPHEQPEFLRRSVRRPRREDEAGPAEGEPPARSPATEDTGSD
jgi:hypothetical protein